MKQKSGKKLAWKKVLLGVSLSILGIAGVTILSIFLWMQTWKTYQFPDGSGSIRYPSTWYTGLSQLDIRTNQVFSDHQVFTEIMDVSEYDPIMVKNQKATVSIYVYRKEPDSNLSTKNDMDYRDSLRRYEASHNGHIYGFNPGLLSNPVADKQTKFEKLFKKLLLDLIIHTVHFNK